jgi:hypothetical protein
MGDDDDEDDSARSTAMGFLLGSCVQMQRQLR